MLKKDAIKKTILVAVGIGISVASLFLVFKDLNYSQFIAAIKGINVWLLVLAVLLYWGGLVVVRTFLVRHLLSGITQIGYARVYRCISIGFMVNNVLPLRLGDMARTGALAKAGNVRFSSVLGGLTFERMVDFFMAALVAFGAVMTVPVVPMEIQLTAVIAAVALGTSFIVLFFVVRRGPSEKQEGNRVFVGIWNLFVRFSKGFHAIGSIKGAAIVFGLGLLMWSIGVATISLKLAAFNLEPTLPNSLLVFACLGFAVALPSAPGYVGVYQVACVIALTAIGVSEEVAAAFGLISWVADVSSGNIAGALGMTLEGLKLKDLKVADTE